MKKEVKVFMDSFRDLQLKASVGHFAFVVCHT